MKKLFKPSGKWLIAYDTDCVFCVSSIHFILRREKTDKFYFTSLNSTTSNQLLSKNKTVKVPDSIYLYDGKTLFFQSDAVLKICSHLKFPWNILKALMIVPKFLRDAVYNFIAKHRYSIISEKKDCPLPTKQLLQRIID